MTELSGTLDGVGLPAIVRFLIGLDRTGCLRVSQQDWQGQIYFQAGRVIGASLGSRTGLPALDALTESLPAATFVFDSQPPTMPVPNIRIGRDALLAHLDDLATRVASGERTLPTVDAVPLLVASADADDGDDAVPVDRGELQTLLAVDGRRTAREIVAERGTFDALWQLRDLIQAGLVRLAETPGPVGVAAAPRGPAGERHLMDIPLDQAQPPEQASRCPKLGFQDDPAHAFERPTRLHRCFAAGTPLPLSLDQQRELCLSEQFGTCPRLTSVANHQGRILRLPFVARVNAGRSGAAEAEPTVDTPPEPARLRVAQASPREETEPRPMPLRSRMPRPTPTPSAAGAMTEPSVPPVTHAVRQPPSPPQALADRQRLVEPSVERRLGNIPVRVIATVGGVVLVIALALAYLGLAQSTNLFGDETVDPSALPNSRLVAAGTPITAIDLPRATAATSPQPSARVFSNSNSDSDPASDVASRTESVRADQVASPVAPAALPTQAAPPAAPVPAPTAVPVPVPDALVDERFSGNAAPWPNDPEGVAWIADGSYHIVPRQAGQFVAIGAPIASVPSDVAVSATFRKLAGPSGGGYGIIVRDQQPDSRNGINQGGQYYVLEAGDRGEIGIWRREMDRWVDLLAWQRSSAVKAGTTSNDISVRAVGSTLSLSVNGTLVATVNDDTFGAGGVGVFVGGDGNQVALERFVVQRP